MNKIKLVLRVRFLKILHESSEESWVFNSRAEFKGLVKRVESPKRVILLLHGLGQRGKRIYRKLLAQLPSDALIIAPNGPFPFLVKKKVEQILAMLGISTTNTRGLILSQWIFRFIG